MPLELTVWAADAEMHNFFGSEPSGNSCLGVKALIMSK